LRLVGLDIRQLVRNATFRFERLIGVLLN